MRDIRQIDMGYQYHSNAVVPDGSPDADPPGTTYTQSGDTWRDVYGIGKDGAVLIRPDGIVAWRSATSRNPEAATTVVSDSLLFHLP